MNKLQEVVNLMDKAGKIAAFTGAGISAESGIPTFRGEGGIWGRYNPAMFGNIPGLALAFIIYPQRLLNFGIEAIETFTSAKPNPAHLALGRLESMGRLSSVITQNIDNLHERGGSTRVIKLHGDMYRMRCRRCEARTPLDENKLWGILEELKTFRGGRIKLIRKLRNMIPRCEQCGGMLRPDVVFFGEGLPRDELQRSHEEAVNCDLMLIVGTSGVVFPAAGIPNIARKSGRVIVEINGEPSPLSSIAHHTLLGRAGDLLPQILERLNT